MNDTGRVDLRGVSGGHGRPGWRAAQVGELRDGGVEVTDLLQDRVEPPTVSAVTVCESDGERTVVSHNAGSFQLAPPAGLDSLVARAGVVLLDGHHPRLALAAAAAAGRLG